MQDYNARLFIVKHLVSLAEAALNGQPVDPSGKPTQLTTLLQAQHERRVLVAVSATSFISIT